MSLESGKRMIFETHAHYDDEKFNIDRETLLASLPEKGIGRVINVGASIETTRTTLELAERYEHVYAAVGVHPSDVGDLNEATFSWLREQTGWEKTAAIGEIGLDYYWDKEPEVQERQRYWFRRQLALAKETKLPVIIHSREAAADTLQIVKEAGRWETSKISETSEPSGSILLPSEEHISGQLSESKKNDACGVIHCYSYSPELAKEFVKLGYYIGVGGVVTFKNAKKLKETVQQIPLERILLETDCPYMAPEPYRGKRNDSSYIPYVVEMIAELKNITPKEVERVTWDNAMQLFSRVR